MNKLIFSFLALTLLACNPSASNDETESEETVQSKSQNTGQPQQVIESYENGVVKIRGKKMNGKRVGKWESFYANGYKWSESDYKNGFRDGPFVVYYRNGMMRYDGRYQSDERSGVWQFYDTTGVLLKRIDMDIVETVPDSLFN